VVQSPGLECGRRDHAKHDGAAPGHVRFATRVERRTRRKRVVENDFRCYTAQGVMNLLRRDLSWEGAYVELGRDAGNEVKCTASGPRIVSYLEIESCHVDSMQCSAI
jgi:hypothetical protein